MFFGVWWVHKYRYTHILSFDGEWRWEFGFTPRLLCPEERVPDIH
jgi:hypothetical protein